MRYQHEKISNEFDVTADAFLVDGIISVARGSMRDLLNSGFCSGNGDGEDVQ